MILLIIWVVAVVVIADIDLVILLFLLLFCCLHSHCSCHLLVLQILHNTKWKFGFKYITSSLLATKTHNSVGMTL